MTNGTRRIEIAPSVLSADFAALERDIRAAEAGGADQFHLDVMDGHFVPNLTFGPMVVEAINRLTDLPLVAHLMITNPGDYAEAFVKAGADGVIIHVETQDDPTPILRQIRDWGAESGITLNPDTPFEAVAPWLPSVDLFLVMSVNPGWGGQSFMPEQLQKARDAVAFRRDHGLNYRIHIDGGIGPGTAPRAVEAGCEVLVAGSAVFRAEDPGERVRALREAAEAVARA